MNLFRSEEHLRRWTQFNPDSAESIMPLADRAILQGTESRKHFLDRDLGLGGRPRKTDPEVEKARRAVGKNLRTALRKIGEQDKRLRDHLRAAIPRPSARFVAYRPPPDSPTWLVSTDEPTP